MNKIIERLCLGMSGIFILCFVGLFGFGFSYVIIQKIAYIGLMNLIAFGIISVVGLVSLAVVILVIYTFGTFIDTRLTKAKQWNLTKDLELR